jgi:hypothetical protein
MAIESSGEVELEQRHPPLGAPDRRMISSTGTGDGPRSSSTDASASSKPRRLAAPAPGEIGHRCERLRGGGETGHQLAISGRPDPGRSYQPQPVDEIFDPIRGSVPFIRRRIFSRCFHRTSNAKPSSIEKSTE